MVAFPRNASRHTLFFKLSQKKNQERHFLARELDQRLKSEVQNNEYSPCILLTWMMMMMMEKKYCLLEFCCMNTLFKRESEKAARCNCIRNGEEKTND